MQRWGWKGIVIGVLVMLAWAAPVAAQNLVLPRPGHVGLGLQMGYGGLLDEGNVGSTFGAGPIFAARLRYRMRYERALGLSFEAQAPEARVKRIFDPADEAGTLAPDELKLITSGLELLQLFGTRTPTTKMLLVGVGIAQMRAKLNNGETELSGEASGDGLYISGGAGIERFVYRSFAIELSGRYQAIFREGEPNHNFTIAAGFIFYASS